MRTGKRNSPCSLTKTWCLIRKWAAHSAAVATTRQASKGLLACGAAFTGGAWLEDMAALAGAGRLAMANERKVGPAVRGGLFL
jgi:hypothetical protein